jgi:hypothetical protein
MTANVALNDQDSFTLRIIAEQTGKSAEELIYEAIKELISRFQQTKRLELLRQARGMWQSRDDLPELETLRAEMNRT